MQPTTNFKPSEYSRFIALRPKSGYINDVSGQSTSMDANPEDRQVSMQEGVKEDF